MDGWMDGRIDPSITHRDRTCVPDPSPPVRFGDVHRTHSDSTWTIILPIKATALCKSTLSSRHRCFPPPSSVFRLPSSSLSVRRFAGGRYKCSRKKQVHQNTSGGGQASRQAAGEGGVAGIYIFVA